MHLMNFNITSLIAVPLLPSYPYPFPDLPIELIRTIFEIAACQHMRTARSFLLVSTRVRQWVHPIVYKTVEIFGLQRMIDFAAVFAEQSLLATSVRNLTLYDDTPGDFVSPALALDSSSTMSTILALCPGVRRLAVNYIRGIPTVNGPKPYELTVRRGLRGITLETPPLDGVTHLHCRYEQVLPYFLARLATARLTHMCFTHHIDIPTEACQEVVERILQAPRLQVLIVEVAYQRWHEFEDPAVRRLLAENTDGRLFVRLSKYDTVRPCDDHPVFSDEEADGNVWDIARDTDWRHKIWDEATISRVYNLIPARTLPNIIPNN